MDLISAVVVAVNHHIIPFVAIQMLHAWGKFHFMQGVEIVGQVQQAAIHLR